MQQRCDYSQLIGYTVPKACLSYLDVKAEKIVITSQNLDFFQSMCYNKPLLAITKTTNNQLQITFSDHTSFVCSKSIVTKNWGKLVGYPITGVFFGMIASAAYSYACQKPFMSETSRNIVIGGAIYGIIAFFLERYEEQQPSK